MPKQIRYDIFVVLFMSIVCLTASRAEAADAANGEQLARRWCSSCHMVAANQSGPTTEAPPFTTIAARSDLSADQIAMFLLDPHSKMPNMQLYRAEADDIAAYIKGLNSSLKKP